MSFEGDYVEATENLRRAFLHFADSAGAKTWIEAVELLLQTMAWSDPGKGFTWRQYVNHKTMWEMDGRPLA